MCFALLSSILPPTLAPPALPHNLRPDALRAGGGFGWWLVLPGADMAVKIYNLSDF
jgi:hypothetical protein